MSSPNKPVTEEEIKLNENRIPPLPPGDRPSSGSNSPRPSISKVGSVNRKSRAMRINIASNSVQFDTSTILDDFLFLGAKGITADMEKLSSLGVEYIINCTQDPPPSDYPQHIRYLHVDVGDTASDNIAQYFVPACDFIETARVEGKGVLVHCTMGMSRSCSIVLAYLVKHFGMSLAQALTHVKERRPVASPNPGFMVQLVDFERSIRGKASIDAEAYSSNRFGETKFYTVN